MVRPRKASSDRRRSEAATAGESCSGRGNVADTAMMNGIIHVQPMAEPTIVLDLIDAFRSSKVMFTADSLGVFDRLARASADAATLASEMEVNADALERLLDTCVGLGLLVRSDGAYSNSEVAREYLCSDSPGSLSGYVRYSDTALYPIWGNLRDAVREGS